MARKVMKLVDPSTGLMECRVCGARHHANIVGRTALQAAHYARGSWQCRHGCKLKPPVETAETPR